MGGTSFNVHFFQSTFEFCLGDAETKTTLKGKTIGTDFNAAVTNRASSQRLREHLEGYVEFNKERWAVSHLDTVRTGTPAWWRVPQGLRDAAKSLR